MDEWRSIPIETVCWEGVSGATRRRVNPIYWNIREPRQGASDHEIMDSWHGMTLGQVADLGEKRWRNLRGFGPMAVEIIKITIDAAAAGVDVTMAAQRGYKPRPFVPPPQAQEE